MFVKGSFQERTIRPKGQKKREFSGLSVNALLDFYGFQLVGPRYRENVFSEFLFDFGFQAFIRDFGSFWNQSNGYVGFFGHAPSPKK